MATSQALSEPPKDVEGQPEVRGTQVCCQALFLPGGPKEALWRELETLLPQSKEFKVWEEGRGLQSRGKCLAWAFLEILFIFSIPPPSFSEGKSKY